MTDNERADVATKLMEIGKSVGNAESGDQRDIATLGCIAGLCFAITKGREEELADLILTCLTPSETTSLHFKTGNTSH